MAEATLVDARIITTNNILLALPEVRDEKIWDDLAEQFCGEVITNSSRLPTLHKKTVYLCGNISSVKDLSHTLENVCRVVIIKELSHNYSGQHGLGAFKLIDLAQVPLLVHGVGVYYRRFFTPSPGREFFHCIQAEHVFQSLTESNKPGTALRTGIYLTPVEKVGEELHFNLLRCSSNLSGPTGNFHATDRAIVDSLNREASYIFQGQAPLNHVLAQVYHNTTETRHANDNGSENGVGNSDGNRGGFCGGEVRIRQTKAKIKAHADKTKDMPRNAIMAFCTFYDKLDRLKPMDKDPYDYGHKGRSGLTKLRFRLKEVVAARPGCTLTREFSVTLYPNSAFFIPLCTNRLYTHEIVPAGLDSSKLPTRLGYVVRCSSTAAVYKDGRTFLKIPQSQTQSLSPLLPAAAMIATAEGVGQGSEVKPRKGAPGVEIGRGTARNGDILIPLEPPTTEGMSLLREYYARENRTDEVIDYGDRFRFSMNKGDYYRPALAEDFRWFALPDMQPPGQQEQLQPQLQGQLQGQQAGVSSHQCLSEDSGSSISTSCSLFEELLESVQFDKVTNGRRGAVLVRPDPERGVPIVRTTTKYSTPAQCFSAAHARLAQHIQDVVSLKESTTGTDITATGNSSASSPPPPTTTSSSPPPPPTTTTSSPPLSSSSSCFNNALIECYTNDYTTMGAHSDQALDLAEGSTIAVYTCYRYPERAKRPPRKLVIESKELGGDVDGSGRRCFEIPLIHNSVVLFSLDTNRRFRHKIILDTTHRSLSTSSATSSAGRRCAQVEENEWLGMTLRTSKTFVQFQRTHAASSWSCGMAASTGTTVKTSSNGEGVNATSEEGKNASTGIDTDAETCTSFGVDESEGVDSATADIDTGAAHFSDGTPIVLANKTQCKEFYALRRKENEEQRFEYPFLPYTISASDLMPPLPPS